MIARGNKLRGPQLYTHQDIAALSSAALLARNILDGVLAGAVAGLTPRQLDRECRERIESAGAVATMMHVIGRNGRPFGHACSISIDNTVAHARPGDRPLRDGQIVTIDLMLSLDGWHADVADTVVVGGGGHALMDALEAVWNAGLAAIRPRAAWSTVAAAMADAAENNHVRLVGGLAGHGIGLAPHELPALPLVPRLSDLHFTLLPGMVFTLEPALSTGSGEAVDSEDGWAILTADGALAAGREAMIAMETGGYRVLGGPGLMTLGPHRGTIPFAPGRVRASDGIVLSEVADESES